MEGAIHQGASQPCRFLVALDLLHRRLADVDNRKALAMPPKDLLGHARQRPLPFDRQGFPNRAEQVSSHRAIQSSASRRTTLGSQAVEVRRVASTYQRRLVWDIERFFNKPKQFRRVATRYDKLLANHRGFVQLASTAVLLR